MICSDDGDAVRVWWCRPMLDKRRELFHPLAINVLPIQHHPSTDHRTNDIPATIAA